MKLAAFALATTLGLGTLGTTAQADPPARPRGELHEILLERFDRDHDGRLDPKERRRAIRALRRLARRLAMRAQYEKRGHEAGRDARVRSMVERYDRNGDGVVTPDEMPPGAARRLRPSDRPAARPTDRGGDGRLEDRDPR
jgi:hypothetical protein